MKRTLLALLAMLCLLAASGCKENKDGSKDEAQPAAGGETGDEERAEAAKPAAGEPESEAGNAGQDGDEIEPFGIPECDDYIAKMMRCFENDEVPAETRDAARASFKSAVEGWRKLPKSVRANLPATCKASLDAAKQAYEKVGCEF